MCGDEPTVSGGCQRWREMGTEISGSKIYSGLLQFYENLQNFFELSIPLEHNTALSDRNRDEVDKRELLLESTQHPAVLLRK